ncbi:cytochrome c5 family protein [Candidatus Berkiella cookevillensis]|uniref:Cytochrome c5 family protein n=1 Tax=Candidatus Berkiella cookevillensis TaxID=437022 RepID=A0AAE3HU08_9GAMM|nr:cytochrome c5 family protein [Candidatus Berkiella cookevillensis]
MTKNILLIALSCFWLSPLFACQAIVDNMDSESIAARIKPVGIVSVEGGSTETPVQAAPSGPTDPKKIYDTYCTICHQTGIAGAPKFHNKADWESRLAVGIDALLQSAIKGKGGMPPKGTCMQCSDDALKATIEYMLP